MHIFFLVVLFAATASACFLAFRALFSDNPLTILQKLWMLIVLLCCALAAHRYGMVNLDREPLAAALSFVTFLVFAYTLVGLILGFLFRTKFLSTVK